MACGRAQQTTKKGENTNALFEYSKKNNFRKIDNFRDFVFESQGSGFVL